jgi:hypothetical protein
VLSENRIVVVIVIVVAAWAAYVFVRNRLVDAKYNCRTEGGRHGEVRVAYLDREAVAPCQPGGHGEIVMLKSKLAWADGQPLGPADRDHLAEVLEQWGKARGRRFHVIVER